MHVCVDVWCVCVWVHVLACVWGCVFAVAGVCVCGFGCVCGSGSVCSPSVRVWLRVQ